MWHFARLCFKSGKPILTGNLFSRHYLIYGCTTKGKSKDMEILHIVMPAYNEEANIEKVIDSWYPNLGDNKNSRLVIADSGSTDRTHQILCELKEKYSRLVILTDTKKQHGPKVIALYNYAIKNGAEYIFQTDSDGQTNPDEESSDNVPGGSVVPVKEPRRAFAVERAVPNGQSLFHPP